MKQMKAQQSSFAIEFEEGSDTEEKDAEMTGTNIQPVCYEIRIVCQEDLNISTGTWKSVTIRSQILVATFFNKLVPNL